MISQENVLPTIEIESASSAQRSIILLHGLGADGSDFVPLVSELHLPISLCVRFIFPHAPHMPVTINNGYEMRAWFDIDNLSPAAKIDEKGIAASVTMLEELVKREESRGIETNNIILAGFSQGAVIALTTGLRYPKPLAGLLVLSSYLPLADKVLQNASSVNRQIPIFIAHGTEDPIVPYALGKASYVTLKQAGYPVSWHSYPMPHSICASEINDISQWMQGILNTNS